MVADMGVVIVGQTPPPVHGSTLVCSELVGALQGAGFDVQVVEKRFSASVTDVGKPSLRKTLMVPQLAVEVLRSVYRNPSPVIYFISLSPGAFLVDALNVAALKRGSASPIILYIHGRGFRELAAKGGFWARTVAKTLRAADMCVTLTSSLAGDIAPWVPEHKRAVIRNPVPGDDPGPQPPPPSARFLFLSNLVREKGADVFLEAAAIVAEAHPESSFTVAGAAYDLPFEAELASMVDRSSLRGRVHFFGPANHDSKTDLFSESSVLVFPSRYQFEASPLTILEAKRAGRGVIASTQGGIPDMISPGIDGALVKDCNPTELAGAMLDVIDRSGLAAEWGVAARADYEQHYSAEEFRNNWIDLLEQLV